MKKKKKVLILTASFGHGHLAAAKGTKAALEKLYSQKIDVEIVNFIESFNESLNKAIQKFYEKSIKISPAIWRFIYKSSDSTWNAKLFNILNYPLVYGHFRKILKDKKPDLIISTHPLFDYLLEKFAKTKKFISIITDSSLVHRFWLASGADFFIVANADTAKELKNFGIKEERIKDLGFPIDYRFFKTYNPKTTLKKLSLNQDKFTILLLPTGLSLKKNIDLVKKVNENCEHIQLVIVTGEGEEFRKKLEQLEFQIPVSILGWTDEIPQLMQAAHLIITKAGGATIQECVASKVIPVVCNVIPGQEEGNIKFITHNRLGVIALKTPELIIEILKLSHPKSSQYRKFSKNIKKQPHLNTSFAVAKFIAQCLKIN